MLRFDAAMLIRLRYSLLTRAVADVSRATGVLPRVTP